MRVVGVVACALLMSGCITKAQHEQQLAEAGPKEDAFCRSIGAKPGSEAYTNCRMTMRQQLLASQAQERVERSRASDAMALAGASLMQPRPVAAPVTCTSNTFAGTTTTNCR